jgi:hypothetical protein
MAALITNRHEIDTKDVDPLEDAEASEFFLDYCLVHPYRSATSLRPTHMFPFHHIQNEILITCSAHTQSSTSPSLTQRCLLVSGRTCGSLPESRAKGVVGICGCLGADDTFLRTIYWSVEGKICFPANFPGFEFFVFHFVRIEMEAHPKTLGLSRKSQKENGDD